MIRMTLWSYTTLTDSAHMRDTSDGEAWERREPELLEKPAVVAP